MANIRVKCPTCQTDLEIDAEFEGQEVECGNCLQVFVATPASTSRSGGSRSRNDDDDDYDDRPKKKKKKKKRRRDDDDYDHDYDDEYDYYDRPRSGGSNGLAVAALVVGIIAIPAGCCCPLIGFPTSLAAIIMGSISMRNEDGKGLAIGGLVCGLVGLIITIINAAAGAAMNMNGGGFN